MARASDASRLRKELAEARAQQAATAAILKVISRSPNDVQPVFQAIVEHARRLMGGLSAALIRVVGAELHLAAMTHTTRSGDKALEKFFPSQLSGRGIHSVAARDRIPVIVRDTGAEWGPQARAMARARGYRSVVAVPLLRKGLAVGVVSVTRREAGDFTRHEIALLKTFADQAVIAIENVRLFNETKESLERQTATAEILRVISRSPTDVRPVFYAICRSAARLLGTRVGINIVERDGIWLKALAVPDASEEFGELHGVAVSLAFDEQQRREFEERIGRVMRHYPMPLDPGRSIVARAIATREIIAIADTEAADVTVLTREGGRALNFRSIAYVPLVREGAGIGTINIASEKPGALLTDKQRELMQTFADQAVIAIENVRLFNETREALERQTATAEILKVIARSPSDVQPVFDTIAQSAMRLTGSTNGALFLRDGAQVGVGSAVGPRGVSARKAFERDFPAPIETNVPAIKAIREGHVVRVADLLESEYSDAVKERARTGYRASLFVPMLREGAAIGAIGVARPQPGLYNDHHVTLLQTFADQAVIAIENVRLFNETKEALERQTATAQILKVIASSPSDVQPVFDAIAEAAVRLIGGFSATVSRVVGEEVHLMALTSTSKSGDDAVRATFPRPIGEGPIGRAIATRAPAFRLDTNSDPDTPPEIRAMARARGYRSLIAVPMLRESDCVGTIAVTRREAGAFSDHHVNLLKTFADQAVIAIENVRLFNETNEALETQTATAEILKVISESPTSVQPVLDAIVQSAIRLVYPWNAAICMLEGELIYLRAAASPRVPKVNLDGFADIFPLKFDSDAGELGQALAEHRIVGFRDSEEMSEFEIGKKIARAGRYRAAIAVPLVREGAGIGAIVLTHPEPGQRPSEKQLALIQTFASQAVIAIENVRLFNETKDALDRQTATAEILKVISQSTTDVQPVLEAIVGAAAKLFPQCNAFVFMRDGGLVRLRAMDGVTVDDRLREDLGRVYPVPFDPEVSTSARAMAERRPNACADTEAPDVPEHIRRAGRAARFRSNTVVPLVRDDEGIGSIVLTDPKPGHTLDSKQVALLQTFADQAVIAIENVRLFNETKEALERQTTTAEILRVIASSPSDVQPVFDAIAGSAMRLIGGSSAAVLRLANGTMNLAASTSTSREGDEALRKLYPMPLSYSAMSRKAMESGKAQVNEDMEKDKGIPPEIREMARKRGFRSRVMVPMMREGGAFGVISVVRPPPGPFSPHHIALLQTFADQAVIAIENVRLFNETKEALERQTATAEILKVIAGSPTDVQPVFDVIVKSAVRLCGARFGRVYRYDGSIIEMVASHGLSTSGIGQVQRTFPRPASDDTIAGRVILKRLPYFVKDIEHDASVPALSRQMIEALGTRSQVTIPMLRAGESIGAITMGWEEPEAFDDQQVALLKTFADQAVIAIENVRLFKELQQRTEALTKSVGQLTALGEVGQAISSTLDLEQVLQTIVSRAVQLTGMDAGSIYEYDAQAEVYRLQAAEKMEPELVEAVRKTPIRKGDGATGRTAVTLEPVQVADIEDTSYQGSRKDNLRRTGYRAVLAVPLLREDILLGALQVFRKTPGPFAPEVVELLKTFATQSAMAIQNARLFREIAEKGKQLEVASRHKSDFLASMSHELRTPLNAILGFNEMLLGQVYGEVPADMQEPLEDIQKSGKHLLRLINNVLDLAKIEAGRMELALSDYSVQDTVESVRATLRPLAAEKGLEFIVTVPQDLPLAYGDSGRITQCLMNLAGNSLKFTKAGRVEIAVAEKDGLLTYRVTDTGVGIPPEKIGSLFTEFKQTDATIASEYGGTGLGLSISKKFVEMHGGRIWIESEPGRGSAFIFEIPLRVHS